LKKKLRVLFVDDQQILLNAVERVIRREAKNWEALFADSAAGALEKLDALPIDVIVSDVRMPGMDGVELLSIIKEKYPNVIRFILSGYSSNERTMEAVRVAHQFFLKPFSTREIIDGLELTHSLYKRIRNPGLQGIISSIDRLPTPRRVFYEISELLNDPDVSLEKISEIISKDTGISGKILQIVNSAFFGQSHRITDIQEAINILGIETIRSLILIVGIASDSKEILGGIISIDLYSNHCLEVARLAKWIAAKLKYPQEDQNTLFTIGLLHDTGRLIMLKKYAEVYTQNEWKEDPFTAKLHISQIEKLADDHACIGAALIALWGLPSTIVNTVAFYPQPQNVRLDPKGFCRIIYIADGISNWTHTKSPISMGKGESIGIDTLLEEEHVYPIESWIEEMQDEQLITK
jgi:HD-like signal output (HDOD) protein